MPVDKFGRMSDLKTKDTGVSLTYINNNYVRSDGETPITGSLDMRGNTLYNVADPVNPQDVVTKVYVDNTKGSGVIGRKTGNGVSIKENLDFLGKQKIKNLPDPVNDHDAATKEYVDTTTVPFLKLDQTKYNTKGDIDIGDQFTVLNVKTPIDDNHITDKKYVDEMDNLKSAFTFKNGAYYAKGGIIMRKNKLGGLQEPINDGEAATKKYVDDTTKNLFIDENDNIAFGLNVDMEGNQILGLPEPVQDEEPATKKYVDDLQTQYIDKRGNVKFDRSINVGNNRIFAVKEPKKDYEATNKKYVDDTINKRIQEEKDNFLPQDPATKEYVDEAIKQVAGGDILVSKEGVFIKANGHYRATAPLDIDNHKMENLPDPVDEKDAVNKKYIDEIVENLTLKQGLIRENGGFNLVDSYINMNFHNIRNVGLPKDEADAVPRRFVDSMIKEVEEKINKRKQLIAVHARYCGPLKKGEYQFKFSGANFVNCEESLGKYEDFKGSITGFVMPHSGHIKKIICEILTYRSLENIAQFFLDFITEHKKDIQLGNIPALEKAGYVDIEDVLKKGIDELKKNIEKENILNETNTRLRTYDNVKSLFQIVKFEKSFNPKDYLTVGTLPKIISSVLIETIDAKVLAFDKKTVGIGAIVRNLNNDYISLSEEDVINIKTNYNQEDIIPPFDGGNIERIFELKFKNFITIGLNYNFTFLIELDPL